MTAVLKSLVSVAVLAALGGCASRPKAPTVDEWRKQPVNSKDAVELQGCRSQLKNTQLILEETSRLANAASSALKSIGGRCGAAAHPTSTPSMPTEDVAAVPAAYTLPAALEANTVYVLLFGYGSSAVDLTAESAMQLAEAVKGSQLIVVRARTDGVAPDAGNEGVARRRAAAVKSYLVALGVPEGRIRATYQAVGDHAANNEEDAGRALNRRAEVEVYKAAPRLELLTSAAR